MNVDFINPFLNAVVNVLKMMTFTDPKPEKPFLKKTNISKGDITGIVGLTGPVNGSIAVSFSEKAILTIVTNMLGEEFCEINQEVRDAVGELSNMICGDARRALEAKGYRFQASIPTVIDGKGHTITHVHKGPTLVIPFTIGDAPFFVEACFER
ncbi:MAG: chemotaxis protein CheX [Nitrospinota bacterium]|nr:MAG: chemotaxis protein CheX [Nitrospinota bacterium]